MGGQLRAAHTNDAPARCRRAQQENAFKNYRSVRRAVSLRKMFSVIAFIITGYKQIRIKRSDTYKTNNLDYSPDILTSYRINNTY